MDEYIDYNGRKLHFSLDMYNHETPLRAFANRNAAEAVRKDNPKWMKA